MRSLLASMSRGLSVRPTRAGRRRAPAHSRPAASGAAALFQPLEGRVLFSAGRLDTTFGGGDGKVLSTTGFGFETHAAPVPGGGWVVAGAVRNDDGTSDFGVRRYGADGSLDTSFGRGGADGDGAVTVDFGADSAAPQAIVVAPDGKIVVAGIRSTTEILQRALLLARLNADGTPDASFGSDGKVATTFGGERIGVGGVEVQPDRRIVVAGEKDSSPFVARYTVAGAPDPSFGGGDNSGTGYTQFDFFEDSGAELHDVALAPGGKVVAVGEVGVGPHGGDGKQLLVLRLTPEGFPDPTFGGGDVGRTGYGQYDIGLFANGTAVLPLSDGRIVVGALDAEDANDGDINDMAQLHRLSADGRSDTLLPSPHMTEVADLALTPAGGFLAAGTRGGNFALSAYRADGTRDSVFGDAAVADFGGNDVADRVVMRKDGHVDVAGFKDFDFAVARYVGTATTTPPGQVVYQAESARLSGATVAKDNAGYTGSGYADFQHASGDFIEWTVNAPAAGSYRLTFRYANGGATDRSLELKLNGSLAKSHLSLPPTGGWAKWGAVSVDFPLRLGSNTVRLTSNGFNGPNVDSLAVAQVPGSTQDRTLQAEEARVTGASVSHSNAGYTGTGYVDFNHASGDAIEWDVTLTEEAQYSFDIRYANGGSTERPLSLEIGNVTSYRLPFSPTGSWGKWGLTGASLRLAAGTYHIRLSSIGFNGPNVDALIVHEV
jgi:uncharacterized delta-60 repeat protein